MDIWTIRDTRCSSLTRTPLISINKRFARLEYGGHSGVQEAQRRKILIEEYELHDGVQDRRMRLTRRSCTIWIDRELGQSQPSGVEKYLPWRLCGFLRIKYWSQTVLVEKMAELPAFSARSHNRKFWRGVLGAFFPWWHEAIALGPAIISSDGCLLNFEAVACAVQVGEKEDMR